LNNQQQNRKTTNKTFLFHKKLHQKTNLYLLKALQTPNPTNRTHT